MLPRIEAAIEAIEEAQEEGRKHACVTDPDARMMGEGREKPIRECHSFEVAVDPEAGLLVAGQSTNVGPDNGRLLGLVEAAGEHEPNGVVAVDADSGYYSGESVAALLERSIDTCIPDSNTACDLHRGQPVGTTRQKSRGTINFAYDNESDCYRCPEANRLLPMTTHKNCGQIVKVYRAERDCTGCPLASACLTQPKAKRRTLNIGRDHEVLEAARQRFGDPEHVERYRHRAEAVETVFAFIRSALGFHRWSLRGSHRVGCEARLFTLAYQMRKAHVGFKGLHAARLAA
jgi:hypothetical protein